MSRPIEELVVLMTTEADSPELVTQAYALRHRVFVEEQQVPIELERDEHDQVVEHVVASRSGRVIGTGRLVVEVAGFAGLDHDLGPIGHLGRLAVLLEERGLGVGVSLVRALEARADDRHLRAVYLGAQTSAVKFYERLSYAAYGDEFDDAGILHRHMWRRLT